MGKKKSKTQTGRPKKVDEQVLLDVLNQYVFAECQANPRILTERGLYVRLENYAHKLGITNVREYDFRRSEFVEQAIEKFTKASKYQESEITGVAFSPLDMDAVLGKSKDELLEILRVRDAYYERACAAAAQVLEREQPMMAENKRLKDELARMQKEHAALLEQHKELELVCRSTEREAKEYRKIIREYVTPARAEELCQVLPRPGIADDKALEIMREIVMQNLAQPQVLEGSQQAFDPVALFGGSKGKDE